MASFYLQLLVVISLMMLIFWVLRKKNEKVQVFAYVFLSVLSTLSLRYFHGRGMDTIAMWSAGLMGGFYFMSVWAFTVYAEKKENMHLKKTK